MPAKKNNRRIEFEDDLVEDIPLENDTPKKSTKKKTSSSQKSTKAENAPPPKQESEPEIQFKVVPEVKENKESFRYQIVPYVFTFLSLFLFLCLILEDKVGVVGSFTHRVLLGLFSGGAYTIPFFVVYHAFMWHADRKKKVARRKIICSAITVSLVSVVIDVLSGRAIRFSLPTLFAEGADSIGGGVIGGILGSVLRTCFGSAGTLIIIFAVLLAMFLQMFDVTPRSLYISAAYGLKMRKERKAAEKAEAAEAARRSKANVNVYRISKNSNKKLLPGAPEDLTDPQATGNAPAPSGNRKNPLNHKLKETETAEKRVDTKKRDPLDSSLDFRTEEEKRRAEVEDSIDFSFLDKIDNDFLSKKPLADKKKTAPAPEPVKRPEPTSVKAPEPVAEQAIPMPEAPVSRPVADKAPEVSAEPEPIVTPPPAKHEAPAQQTATKPVFDEDIPPFDMDEPVKPAEAKPAPVETKAAPKKTVEAPAMPRGKIDVAQPEGEIDLRNLFENPDNADLIDKISKNEIQHTGEDSLKLGLESEGEEMSDLSDLKPKKAVKKADPPPYLFPPIDLLPYPASEKDAETVKAELQDNALKLVETLKSFNVKTKIIDVSRGPTITRYELAPEAGTRVRSIANLVDDIALNLATSGIRIESPIPGKAAVGIEVPNKATETVYIRGLLEGDSFTKAKSKVTVALGMDVAGAPIYFDIAKMPHLLIAGATGMGKSVCINSLIVSILYKARPDEVKLILIDPKKVELNVYNGIPHLLIPVVSDAKKAAGALHWAVTEMDRRFSLIESVGVRNIQGFNEIAATDPELEPLPQIVIIIDEFADLMMTAPDAVEESVCRLAQLARAAGMHLIIGTQRPSVNVITGLIKSNIPSRIAFTTASQIDSRTIIDIAGAEKLIGRGDMLYAPVGSGKPIRVQGAFISEAEVESITSFLKAGGVQPEYSDEVMAQIEREAERCVPDNKKESKNSDNDSQGDEAFDPMFRPALELAVNSGKISTSLIQRKLELGYGRAAKLIDRMESMGYVSAANGAKPREVLITRQQYQEMVLRDDDSVS
ncbi:MAG: DNA translocase FtsK [Clostridia bacterium]|nr:DNA translocase FtsK [Clostridia bacterium]